MTRLLIVDDHRLFAEALSSALHNAHVDVVGVATNGAEAIDAVVRHPVDLVLLDIGLPDVSGLDLIARLRSARPEIRVVAVSANDDPRLVKAMRRAGFDGFVPKATRLSQMVKSIAAVRTDEVWLGEQRAVPRREAGTSIDVLTDREREVLTLLAECANGEQIAERLSIAPNTVRSHIQNILDKLQVHSRLAAVAVLARSRPGMAGTTVDRRMTTTVSDGSLA